MVSAPAALTSKTASGQEDRIYLSAPDVRGPERRLLLDALDSNWVAPLGPHVDAFEAESAALCGRRAGVATVSGTAALHLALRLVGVEPDTDVLMPTLTFVATANAAAYLGARPTFLDVDQGTWALDPQLVEDELRVRSAAGRLPSAVIAVDMYGQCADYDALETICAHAGVPLVVDAAESLGATWRGRPAGSGGALAILSFNGNKVVTCGGGGMLLCDDAAVAGRARRLAAQAREPGAGYEHVELGYNYRLSNLLAAVGRGQLVDLQARIDARRAINARYRAALADLPGVGFMPFDLRGQPNAWLTCLTLDPRHVVSPAQVIAGLERVNIESRPGWKPLHQQPLYAGQTFRSTGVADRLAQSVLCLPSGSGMREAQVDRVLAALIPLLSDDCA